MPLLDAAAVAEILRCPRCGATLDEAAERCRTASCPHASRGFPSVAGQSVLIDADDSIVEPAAVVPARAAAPKHPLRGLLDRIATPNRVAPRIAERLRTEVRPGSGRDRARVLIVGGGTVGSGLGSLYASPEVDVIAFDIFPSPFTQFVADAHRIPLADGSVDAVIVQAVLEHVLDPWRVVAEIHRVLAADGLVYADTPFLQQVHEGPFDFTRFTESGHRWLFRRFDRIESGVVTGAGSALAWSAEHAVRAVTGSKLLRIPVRIGAQLVGRVVDRLERPGVGVDGACSVYFYGRRSERALAPHEMVAEYRGAQGHPAMIPGRVSVRGR